MAWYTYQITKHINMDNKYSLTQAGNLVALAGVIGLILNKFNINIAPGEIETVLTAAIAIIGLATSWYGRWRQGDLKLSGRYK
jgi:hypothetical protein